ncbi:MAG: hypothetical protein ACREO8_02905 [Luteimonas sp.]
MALGLLVGCTRVVKPDLSGDVDLNRITPEESVRMQLGDNQVFIPGEHLNPDVMPEYPAKMLSLRLSDQVVCVSFVVNRDGSVSSVTPVHGAVGCPANADSSHSEFLSATVDAVSRWDYFSSIRCTFPPGTPDEQKCNGPGAMQEQVAVTLAYRFLFSSGNGAGTVQRSEVAHRHE